MKRSLWARYLGVPAVMFAAGVSIAAEPIGPVDDTLILAPRWPLNGIQPKAEDFRGLPHKTPDSFVSNSAPVGVADKPPTTMPATQPVSPQIKALIDQLGDDSYAKREEAATKLKKLGNEALPALQQAAADSNPQIRTSAQALISEMRGEDKPKPTATSHVSGQYQVRLQGGQIQMHQLQIAGNGVARTQVQMVINGQSMRDTTVEENGRKVHIHEDADGIKMEVTENGQTKETKAKDVDDLKKNEPEAFKFYEKYNDPPPDAVRLHPAR